MSQQVVRNLGISALEMRGEDALDVAPYIHSRSINTVIVELSGNILRVKEDLLQVYYLLRTICRSNDVVNIHVSSAVVLLICYTCYS